MGGQIAYNNDIMVMAATISVIFYIVEVIACWKIFPKAGEESWKSLIPIYNNYLLFKIAGMKSWFWWMLGIAFVSGLIVSAAGFEPNAIRTNSFVGLNLFGAIVYLVTGVIEAAIMILYCVRLSKAFRHDAGFALGLIFLTPIFLLILGFGSSKYDKKIVKTWEK